VPRSCFVCVCVVCVYVGMMDRERGGWVSLLGSYVGMDRERGGVFDVSLLGRCAYVWMDRGA
jgi:hypothetical protein